MSEVADIQIPFKEWVQKQPGIKVVWQRSDRETSGEEGQPDFILLRGSLALCIECKTKEGKVSAAQKRWHDQYAAGGGKVHVCRSLKECMEVTLNWLSGIGRGAAIVIDSSRNDLYRHGNAVVRKTRDGFTVIRPANQPGDQLLQTIF